MYLSICTLHVHVHVYTIHVHVHVYIVPYCNLPYTCTCHVYSLYTIHVHCAILYLPYTCTCTCHVYIQSIYYACTLRHTVIYHIHVHVFVTVNVTRGRFNHPFIRLFVHPSSINTDHYILIIENHFVQKDHQIWQYRLYCIFVNYHFINPFVLFIVSPSSPVISRIAVDACCSKLTVLSKDNLYEEERKIPLCDTCSLFICY